MDNLINGYGKAFKAKTLPDGSVLIYKGNDPIMLMGQRQDDLQQYFDGTRVTDENCLQGLLGQLFEVYFLLDTMCDFNLISKSMLEEFVSKLDPVKNAQDIAHAKLRDLPVPLKVELANDSVTQFKHYVFLRLALLLKSGKKNAFGNKYFLFFVGNANIKGSKNIILGAPFLKEELHFTFVEYLNRASMDIEGDEVDKVLVAKSAALSLEDKVIMEDKKAVTALNMEPVTVPRSMLASSVTENGKGTSTIVEDDLDCDDTSYDGVEWLEGSKTGSSSVPAISSASIKQPVLQRLGPKVVVPATNILERLGAKQGETPSDLPTRKVFKARRDESRVVHFGGTPDSPSRVVEIDSDEYDDMLVNGNESA